MPPLPLFSCPCAAVIATALPLGPCCRSSCAAQRPRTAAVAVARTGQRLPACHKYAALVRRFSKHASIKGLGQQCRAAVCPGLLLLKTHMLTECEQLAPLHRLEPPHLSCASGHQPEPVPLRLKNSTLMCACLCLPKDPPPPLCTLHCFQPPLAILKYLRFGESYFAFGRPDACGAVGKQKASCSQTKGVIIMQQEA